MGLLINIDTGGTLTDFCVIDGSRVFRTKTVTTPFDLSKCLFDGLRKASRELYGDEDLPRLLAATDYVRYSTTQGTNALVERRGPRLGLICLRGLNPEVLQGDAAAESLFQDLVGQRTALLDAELGDSETLKIRATAAVNRLAGEGATRLVVSGSGAHRAEDERKVKRVLLRSFPPQMLGALPIIYAHELTNDDDDVRRTWTALLNAFLHPSMERFLYSAEHRLREHRIRKPLLIFRNDGGASRIARTSAIKTYSSGPRGGAEGIRALAAHYGFSRLVGVDVGGTTTDITVVEQGRVRTDRHARIEGVATSIPLSDVVSFGVGGSSVFRVVDGKIRVGPDSVGSAPGPACFGYGGSQATATDAFLVAGLLDPSTYFGGGLKLDATPARQAIEEHVGRPLGCDAEQAVSRMENAWAGAIAQSLRRHVPIRSDTAMVAFGGAGPLVATRIADAAGIDRVLIPGLAAVFSAFGVGFSRIEHELERALEPKDEETLARVRHELLESARHAMFAEGVSLDECVIEAYLVIEERTVPLSDGTVPKEARDAGRVALALRVSKTVPQPPMTGRFGEKRADARIAGHRRTLVEGSRLDLPLVRVGDQTAGAAGTGPVILEDPYFTARVDAGWAFEIATSGDILLTKASGVSKR